MPRNSFKNIKGEPSSSKPPEQPIIESTKTNHHAFQKSTLHSPFQCRPPTPCLLWPPFQLSRTICGHRTRFPHPFRQKHPDLHWTNHSAECLHTNTPQPTTYPSTEGTPRSIHLTKTKRPLTRPKTLHTNDRHCDIHSPILGLYKSFHQTLNLETYQEIETIKIPIQTNIIHALYQLDALPFLTTLKEALTKHGRKTFCTQCYHLRHFQKDCPFYRCPYCRLIQPKHDEDLCLDNPKYSGPTPIKQESPSPPPRQVPPLKTVKKLQFSPNRQNSNLSSSSNGINKRGCKGKKPEWKKFHDSVDRSLTRQFQEMDRKYDQEPRDFSIASDYQEQYDNTAYDNIDGEPSYSQDFWIFKWNFKCNRGVMLWFSLLFCNINHTSYVSFLSTQTIPIRLDY